MSTYRLAEIFAPKVVALVGASERPGSLGKAVVENLLAGFKGELQFVNPNYSSIAGITVQASIADLKTSPDVVIIATPAATVPDIVRQAADKGVAGAIILTAGLGHGEGSLAEEARIIARTSGMRLIGPNCIGLIAPYASFNASFADAFPAQGHVAVISQSGAITAAMVDWGVRRRIGFSAVVSVGDQLDVDIGDLLDYFALDRRTHCILLYVEAIADARKFMSAARLAARTKPVVVLKAGRHVEGARAAASHTGAMAGVDDAYDAAFRRAGLLRVFDVAELFDAAETLALAPALNAKPTNRLAILTNGGGFGVLAADRLADLGGVSARLSEAAKARLDAALPRTWSGANPIDIMGDADGRRYANALETLLDDTLNDAVLVLNVRTALASGVQTAKAVAEVAVEQRSRRIWPKPILGCWVVADSDTLDVLSEARIPNYRSESEAVRGFMHLARHADVRSQLATIPATLPKRFVPDEARARSIIKRALSDQRTWLDPLETFELLQSYDIAVLRTDRAGDPAAAIAAAHHHFRRGEAVVMKILSPDIIHKSDIGGVVLNLATDAAVSDAFSSMMERIRKAKPDARIDGVVIQPMVQWKHARELIAGISTDRTFGKVILFGHGGTAVEVIDDKVLALPPLDLDLARDMINRTRISKLLRPYRDVPAASTDGIAYVLVKLAQLAADFAEIVELDINPLIANETGVLSLDCRIRLERPVRGKTRDSHMALRPYPKIWERDIRFGDGLSAFVRPIRPEDEPLLSKFLGKISAEDLRLRFFSSVHEFNHASLVRLTQIDYARTMALVAMNDQKDEIFGVARLHADANHETAEYAILVRTDLKGRGLGWQLMNLLIEYARSEGLSRMTGDVLRENSVMLDMCRELGFATQVHPDDHGIYLVTLDLSGAQTPQDASRAVQD